MWFEWREREDFSFKWLLCSRLRHRDVAVVISNNARAKTERHGILALRREVVDDDVDYVRLHGFDKIDVVSAEVYKIIVRIMMLNAKKIEMQWGSVRVCVWSGELVASASSHFPSQRNKFESVYCLSGRVNLFSSSFHICCFLLLSPTIVIYFFSVHSVCAALGLMVLCISFILLLFARWWVYVTVIHLHCFRNIRIVWNLRFFFLFASLNFFFSIVFALSAVAFEMDGWWERENVYVWHAAAHHSFMRRSGIKARAFDRLSACCMTQGNLMKFMCNVGSCHTNNAHAVHTTYV